MFDFDDLIDMRGRAYGEQNDSVIREVYQDEHDYQNDDFSFDNWSDAE